MKRHLLLATVAALSLAMSLAALADPPDKGHTTGGKPPQGQGQGKGQGQGQGKGQGSGGGGGGAGSHGKGTGGGPTFTALGGGAGGGSTGGQPTFKRSTGHVNHPPANIPVLSGWSHDLTGADRDTAGHDWRQQHHGWDSNSPWKQNPNWWRGNAAFRLFLGERLGFFFIPELGYVAVPPEYQNHYWRDGDTLPQWFWRYQVNDYWNYGLPQPPDGCLWVWVDDDIVLIDGSDGYVIDVVRNAF